MMTQERFWYLINVFLFSLIFGMLLGNFLFTPEADAGEVSGEVNIHQIIHNAATEYDLDPKLIKAIIAVESNWNPKAVGKYGELGLMQLHPRFVEGATLAVEQNIWAGAKHLNSIRAACPLKDGMTFVVCYNNGPNRRPKYPHLHPYYKKVISAYQSQI
jgi:hypothetical protein